MAPQLTKCQVVTQGATQGVTHNVRTVYKRPGKNDSMHALVQRRKGINARTSTKDDDRGRGRRARWGSKFVLLWNDGGQTGRGGGRMEMCKMAQIGRAECEGCRRLCPEIVPPGNLCALAPSSARLARGRAADCLGNCMVSVASMWCSQTPTNKTQTHALGKVWVTVDTVW